MSSDLSKFHDAFFEESLEGLGDVETRLLEFMFDLEDLATVHDVFRLIHSIKGGADMFGFDDIASFTHTVETLLDQLRKRERVCDQDIVLLLLSAVDATRMMLEHNRDSRAVDAAILGELEETLERKLAEPPAPSPGSAAPPHELECTAPATSDVAPASAAAEQKSDAAGASIRVAIDKIDALDNTVGELVTTHSLLEELCRQADGRSFAKFRSGLAQLERNIRDLESEVMQIRMVPMSFAFNRFPRLVMDLGQKLDKKVVLELSGESCELDKTIMEKIVDPLVHLVRNALDHGIEPPQERRRAGKPETGTIGLHASYRNNGVVLEVHDDGGGLDADAILAKARAQDLVGRDEMTTAETIHELIFSPGFSTAGEVTAVSGRGVGMDVVRRNVHDAGGTIAVRSVRGEGTRFTIRLPLTLAVLEVLPLEVGPEIYVIPMRSVVESVPVGPEHVKPVAGDAELLRVGDDYHPIIRLHELFEISPKSTALDRGMLVVVEDDNRNDAIFVDRVLDRQQVVINRRQSTQRGDALSSATMLDDGRIATMLTVAGIRRLARRRRHGRRRTHPALTSQR